MPLGKCRDLKNLAWSRQWKKRVLELITVHNFCWWILELKLTAIKLLFWAFMKLSRETSPIHIFWCIIYMLLNISVVPTFTQTMAWLRYELLDVMSNRVKSPKDTLSGISIWYGCLPVLLFWRNNNLLVEHMGTCKMKKCALLNLLQEREGTIQDQIPRGHHTSESTVSLSLIWNGPS